MAAWADLVMDQLDLCSVERAVFVGHSMSGYLTQQIWRDHPHRVAGLGLVGTTWQYALVNEKEAFAELIGNMARDWRTLAPTAAQLLVGSDYLASNPRWLDRWTDHVERNYDLTGMARLIAAINERPDYAPTNRQIDVPTTVIYSAEDRVFSLDVGRNLTAQIPGAEPVEIEGAGHAIPMERPEPVAAAVRALVEKATWASCRTTEPVQPVLVRSAGAAVLTSQGPAVSRIQRESAARSVDGIVPVPGRRRRRRTETYSGPIDERVPSADPRYPATHVTAVSRVPPGGLTASAALDRVDGERLWMPRPGTGAPT